MTTIVFDGRYLAADTRATLEFGNWERGRHCPKCNSRIKHTHIETCKIHIPREKVIFEGEKVIALAGAGSSNMCNFMIYMVESHPAPERAFRIMPKTTDHEESALLVLTEQNVYTLHTSGRLIMHKQLPVAIGTGSQAAELAIIEGANAMKAVRKASLVDPATNDVVDFIKVVQTEKYHVLRYTTAEDMVKNSSIAFGQ